MKTNPTAQFIAALTEEGKRTAADIVGRYNSGLISDQAKKYAEADPRDGLKTWEVCSLLTSVGAWFVGLVADKVKGKETDLESAVSFGEALEAAGEPKRSYIFALQNLKV